LEEKRGKRFCEGKSVDHPSHLLLSPLSLGEKGRGKRPDGGKKEGRMRRDVVLSQLFYYLLVPLLVALRIKRKGEKKEGGKKKRRRETFEFLDLLDCELG